MHRSPFRLQADRPLADGIGAALADEDAVELGADHAVLRGNLEVVPLSVGFAGLGPRLLVAVASGTLGAPQGEDLSQPLVEALNLHAGRPDLVLSRDVVEHTAVAGLLWVTELQRQDVVGVGLPGAEVPVGRAVALKHAALGLPGSRVSKGNEKVLLEVVQRLGGPCLLRGGRLTGQAE